MGFMDSIIDAGKNMLGGNANFADVLSKVQGNASTLLGAAGTDSFLNSAKTALSGMNDGNQQELSQLFSTVVQSMGKGSPETNAGSPVERIVSSLKTIVTNDPQFLQNLLASFTSQSADNSNSIVSKIMSSPIASDFLKNTFAGLVKH
jgi:hypothetical protein